MGGKLKQATEEIPAYHSITPTPCEELKTKNVKHGTWSVRVYKKPMMKYKALLISIDYVIDTESYCYQMKLEGNPNEQFELHGYSDVEYAGYYGTQKMVTGYAVLLNWVVAAWSLKMHKTDTFSVIEAENSEVMRVVFFWIIHPH